MISPDPECCADSGATHHIVRIYTYFLSYCPSLNTSDYAILGDDNTFNISGLCTTIWELNRQLNLPRELIHVPALQIPAIRAPLYSI